MESLFAFLSHLVLFLSLTTLVFAFGAYAALMLRRRQPLRLRRSGRGSDEITFLRRYTGDDHE
jgi:hypothetical protein